MNKVGSIVVLVVMGWMLTDLLLHPKGVQQLGSTTNSLLMTAGNQVTGVGPASGSGQKAVLGG